MSRLKWSRLLRKRPLLDEQHAERSKSQAPNATWRPLASAVCQTSNSSFVIGYLIAFSYSASHAPLTLPGVIFVASIASLLSELCRYEFLTCRRNTSVCSYICTYQNLGELPAYLTGWLQLLGRSSSASLISRALGSVLAQIIGNRLVRRHLTSEWLVAEDTIGIAAQVTVGLFLVSGLKMMKRFSAAIKAATLASVLVFVATVSSHAADERAPAGVTAPLHNTSASHQRPADYSSQQQQAREEFLLSAALIGMSFKHENKEAQLLSRSSLISAYVGVNHCATLLVLVVMSVSAYFVRLDGPEHELGACPLLGALIAAAKHSKDWSVPLFASLAIVATATALVEAVDDARRLLVKLAADGLVLKKLAAHRQWALWLCVALAALLETTLSTLGLVSVVTFVHLAPDVAVGVVVTHRRYCCAAPRAKRWRHGEAPGDESGSDTDIDAAVDEYKTHVYVATVMDWNGSEEEAFNPADGQKIRVLLGVIAIAILTASLSLRWIGDMSAGLIAISLLSLIVYFAALCVVWSKSQKPRAKIATFRVPCVPWISMGASLAASVLLFQLPGFTWLLVCAWLAIGLAVYASYGYKNSRLNFKIPKSGLGLGESGLERAPNLRILPRLTPDISFSSIAVYPQPYSAM